MNNKIENNKTEVVEDMNMNDEDILSTILSIEKNMSVNLAYSLNEASNEILYDELYSIFENVKDLQRDIYEIMFQYGWYSIEKADNSKINEEVNKFKNKLSKLKQD
ncbi:MAG: spore coat protein [Bacilli bacterium]|nr:spore coat protein [Bacilli bacterium]